MTLEEMKAFVRRHDDDVVNGHDLSALDRDLDAHAVDHASAPGSPPGADGARAWLSMLFTGFPDMQATIEDVIAEGDKIVGRKLWSGTHDGPFMGRQPTGKKIRFEGIVIWRIEDGKLAERWAQIDRLGLMQQLGMMPEPGPAGT